MDIGAKAALLISCIAVASCSAGNPVRVRAAGDPVLLSKDNPAAVGRAQLMLGNVGLALEAFRKALRANPSDTVALAGIGDCYAAMTRYDLAQSYYEQALALSPHDRTLLLGIAAVFDQGGQHAKAVIARTEAAAAVAQGAPAGAVSSQSAGRAPTIANVRKDGLAAAATLAIGSITVALPPARPATRLRGGFIKAEARTIAAAATEEKLVREVPQNKVIPAAESASAIPAEVPTATAQESRDRDMPQDRTPTQTASAGIKPADVQSAGQAEHIRQQDLVALLLSRAAPASGHDRPGHTSDETSDALVAPVPRPRLERLSRGEVALITTSTPIWRQPGHRPASTATAVAWVPLMPTPTQANVQILNAARKQGLAAAARSVLVDRGWRKIAVGDAPSVQHRSVVLYPASQRSLGRRLAAQFGIGSRRVEGKAVVLILGRDAASRITGRRTS